METWYAMEGFQTFNFVIKKKYHGCAAWILHDVRYKACSIMLSKFFQFGLFISVLVIYAITHLNIPKIRKTRKNLMALLITQFYVSKEIAVES